MQKSLYLKTTTTRVGNYLKKLCHLNTHKANTMRCSKTNLTHKPSFLGALPAATVRAVAPSPCRGCGHSTASCHCELWSSQAFRTTWMCLCLLRHQGHALGRCRKLLQYTSLPTDGWGWSNEDFSALTFLVFLKEDYRAIATCCGTQPLSYHVHDPVVQVAVRTWDFVI